MLITERIVYLLHMNDWAEKELGAKLASEHPRLKAVEQWQISRWKLGKEKPSRVRRKQIEHLCYLTVLLAFNSPNGFRYICNLGKGYGNHYRGREREALARLRSILTRECPFAPAGRLQIVALTASLPKGVRAQCFCSDQDDPKCFVILVPDDDEWRKNVRDEVFAHVLPMAQPGFDVRDN
jgi:hypothetical protein